MVKDRIYNLIKTLILKADKKYNDNYHERIECLRKAKELATKSDWYFRFEYDFKRLNEQLEQEIPISNDLLKKLFIDEFQENFKGNLIFKEWIDSKLLIITITTRFGVVSSITEMIHTNCLTDAYMIAFEIYKKWRKENV
jgi:hypothetical protein